MKRFISLIVAMALVISLVPAMFASAEVATGDVVTYRFDANAHGFTVKNSLWDGTNKVSNFTYDTAVASLTAPWEFLGLRTGSNYTAYYASNVNSPAFIQYNIKGGNPCPLGDGALAFKFKSNHSGTFVPILEHDVMPTSPIVNIYIYELTADGATSASKIAPPTKASILALTDAELVGTIDMYSATNASNKKTALEPVTIDSTKEYAFVYAYNGANPAVTAGSNASTQLRSLILDKTAVTAFEASIKDESIGKGKSTNILATVTRESGNVADGVAGLSFESNDDTIATVDANGVVTAAADKTGTATITVSANGITDTVDVTVLDESEVTSFEVSAPELIGKIGDSVQITAVAKNPLGNAPTGVNVIYESLTPDVASVSSTGVVTSLKAGQAKIKITAGDKEETVLIAANGYTGNPKYPETIDYFFGQRVLADQSLVSNSGNGPTFFDSYAEIDMEKTAPWKHIGVGRRNGYSLRGTYYWRYQETDASSGWAWVVLKFYVPVAGDYMLSVDPFKNKTGSKLVNFYWSDTLKKDVTGFAGGPNTKFTVSGLVDADKYVGSADFRADTNESGAGELNYQDVGMVSVPKAGEYFFIVYVDPDADDGEVNNFVDIQAVKLTPEDTDIREDFEAESSEAYTPVTAKSYAYTSIDTSSAFDSQTVNVGETVTVEAPDKSAEGYTFLYWAKGLSNAKKLVSTNKSYTYTPAEGNNILVAVYAKNDTNVAEFYNANKQLVKAIKGESVEAPAYPEMAGYAPATAWVDAATGEEYAAGATIPVSGRKIFVAKVGAVKSVNVNGTDYDYGELVTLTATEQAGKEFKGWKKDVNGTEEFVSTSETYTFYAYETCTVEEVWEDSVSYSGSVAKIVLDTFEVDGKTAIMAEFIGMANTIEKGILFGTRKIPMSGNGSQFSLIADAEGTYKGYAIVNNGDGTYTEIIDGVYTK